jgi:YD repeat-containing protein
MKPYSTQRWRSLTAACLPMLAALVTSVAAPAPAARAASLKGPVRSVRVYSVSFEPRGGSWARTGRRLSCVSQYGRTGLLSTEMTYDSNGRPELGTSYRYGPRGRKTEEVRRRFDGTTLGAVERTVSACDAQGHLTREEHYQPPSVLRGVHRFARDAAGRLVADRWYDAEGRPTGPRETRRYDGSGKLTEHVGHDTRGAQEAHRYRYDAQGRLAAEVTRWSEGGESANAYRYDAKGNRVEALIDVTDAHFSERDTFRYDAHGNVTESARYRFAELTRWLTTDTRYDGEGRIAEVTARRPEGTIDHRNAYQYDAQGRITVESRYGPGDSPQGKSTSAYDAEGRLAERRNYAGESLNNRSAYQYDPRGRLARETQYDGEARELAAFTYGYDAADRKLACTGTQNGATEIWSYAYPSDREVEESYASSEITVPKRRTITRHDADGNIVEETRYGPDGAATFCVRSEYSPDGALTSVVQEFGDGSVSERADYVYDGSGRLLEKAARFGDGSLREKTVYTRDSQGREAEAVEYFGQLIAPRIGSLLRYDAHGNMVEAVTGEPTLRHGAAYLRPRYAVEHEITYWR